MFAGQLNKGFRGSLVLIILIFAVSQILNYLALNPLEQEYYPNLFYNYFTHAISGKLLINLINFAFIALALVLVNQITAAQEIVEKQNYFPVFLFLLLSVVGANPVQISSQIFTNVFVLYAIYKLLATYRKEEVLKQIFEAAFWISVSAFITISSIISVPLFFVILLVLRPFHWREWVIALLGFFVPIFIYESMAYLSDFNQWYILDATALYFRSLKVPSFSEYFIPLSAALFLLLFISILHNLMRGFGTTVKKQRMKAILLWFLFFSTFGFFSGGANSSSIILTYAFPLSFFIGDFLFRLKQLKITNTILVLLVLCALVVFAGRLGMI
ncbi:MAG: DUF6427 family protein [bacterium]|nr:DUF6427 family protein [bacterium]